MRLKERVIDKNDRLNVYFRINLERLQGQESKSHEYSNLARYTIALAGGGVSIALALFRFSSLELYDATILALVLWLLAAAALAALAGGYALLLQCRRRSPWPDHLSTHVDKFNSSALLRWASDAYAGSFGDNEEELSRKARYVGVALLALILEIYALIALGFFWSVSPWLSRVSAALM